MELQGSVTLPASPALVWQALNDPDVLRACIPGCEEVRRISPEELHRCAPPAGLHPEL
jgi:carbon monoxide dehydrogenase subunit G